MMEQPHGTARVLTAGADLTDAKTVVILVHGRGATAQSMLSLAPHLVDDASTVAFLAPQAQGNVWYPQRFIAPLDANEPWLSTALTVLDDTIDQATNGTEIDTSKIVLVGFSQGACLALEHAARGSRKVGGVVAFSGGLIGPVDEPHAPLVDVSDLTVYLGTGTIDDHVQPEQVRESARLFEEAGADVTIEVFEGMTHTISDDEIAAAKALITGLN